MQLVHLADVAPQPWRNGGGSTQELLAWPPAAGGQGGPGEQWHCRISVAQIGSNGPFSAFPGIERWFTVLSGEGVVLRFASRRVMLGAGSEPLHFDGAAAPGCDLLDGPTLDLNLMVRRDSGRGGMAAAMAGQGWQSDAPLRAVFSLDEARLQVDQQAPLHLAAGTLAWSATAAGQTWALAEITPAVSPAGRAWWMHFKPLKP